MLDVDVDGDGDGGDDDDENAAFVSEVAMMVVTVARSSHEKIRLTVETSRAPFFCAAVVFSNPRVPTSRSTSTTL